MTGQIQPNPNRMHIFNAFRKLPNGNWLMKGEQIIICICGWSEGFRVFEDREIAETLDKHNNECELRK